MWLKAIYTAVCIALICLGAPALAQEHDHQQWNLVEVGRLVTFSRLDRECRSSSKRLLDCSVSASQDALHTLDEVGALFNCRSPNGTIRPRLSYRGPLTRHDKGPLVIAEFDEVRCGFNPTQQLIPVTPQEFSSVCSRITWKCDVVWISDSDPAVWYIARSGDLINK